MRRLVEVGANGRKLQPVPRAVEIGDDDADLGGQRNGSREKLLGGLRTHRRVVIEAQHRDAGAQDVHRVGVLGGLLEELDDRLRQRARGAQFGLELLQLGLVRQPVVPEEIDDFLVTNRARQVVDVVPGIDQDAVFPHHVAETGGGGDDSFQSG